MKLSIIVPACNEEAHIADSIESLLRQDLEDQVEVVFAANACRDSTVEIIRSYASQFKGKGWDLKVLDLEKGGKTNAMNEADQVATGEIRCYMDADITLDPSLFAEVKDILSVEEPRYASGTMVVSDAESFVTQKFAKAWSELPFMKDGVPGAGLFCVNAAGRSRWQSFPDTFSDDTYVRLLFAPEERFAVSACFYWPMAEGFYDLARVRARQNAHVADIHAKYPNLAQNEDTGTLNVSQLFNLIFKMPLSFLVYCSVSAYVKFGVSGDLTFRTQARRLHG